jgi:AcrR family transcriptional regulator
MGIQDRKERERKRRQEQILNAAIELIEDRGFEATTMDDIAERAELSKGTLYLYFDNKVSLFQAIKKRGLTSLHSNFLDIIQKDLTGAEIVKEMMFSFLNQIRENITFTKAMLLYKNKEEQNNSGSEGSISDNCIHLENELLMLIIRGLQIGIQDGSIKSALNPKVLALQIGFQMRGMLQFFIFNSRERGLQILKENNMEISDLIEHFLHVQFNQST